MAARYTARWSLDSESDISDEDNPLNYHSVSSAY